MFQKTENKYLYYKYNNIYYRDLLMDIYLRLLILVELYSPLKIKFL